MMERKGGGECVDGLGTPWLMTSHLNWLGQGRASK